MRAFGLESVQANRQFSRYPWSLRYIRGKDLPYCLKDATGFGVCLVLDYLQHI